MNGDCHTISPSNLWHENLFVYWYRDQRLHNPNRHLLSNVHPTLLSVLPGLFFWIPGFWLVFGSSWSNRNRIFAQQAGDDLHNFFGQKWRKWMANPSGWNLKPSPEKRGRFVTFDGSQAWSFPWCSATSWGPIQNQCTNHKENGGGPLGWRAPSCLTPPLRGPKFPLYKVYMELIIKGTIPRVPPISLWTKMASWCLWYLVSFRVVIHPIIWSYPTQQFWQNTSMQIDANRIIIYIYRGFPKWWVSPTTMGFPTKNYRFGVLWGYHQPFKETPI